MIDYDQNQYTIKGLSAAIPNVPINVGEVTKQRDKVRDASELALALDDYQVQMCKICKSLGKDDPDWRKYNELRVSTIHAITVFRVSISAFMKSPISSPSNLDNALDELKQISTINGEAVPNIANIRQKTTLTRADIPQLTDTLVNRGKNAAELDQNHVNRFIEKLEQQPSPTNDNISQVRALIYKIREAYEESYELLSNVEETFNLVSPLVRELYQREDLRKIIGNRNTIELRNRINDLHTMVGEYIGADAARREAKKNELTTEIGIRSDELRARLDNIDFSL